MWGTPDSDELFDAVFAEIDDGMDRSTFQDKIVTKVSPVMGTWEVSDMFMAEHKDFDTHYLRPGFCECKPYTGRFNLRSLGNGLGHKVTRWT